MAIRKSEIRRLRRELISRTARIWSRLNKALLKDLNEVAQLWLKKFFKYARENIADGSLFNAPEFPQKFDTILSRTLREALAQGYWLEYLYLQEMRYINNGRKYRGKVSLADSYSSDEKLRDILKIFITAGVTSKIHEEWHDIIPVNAIDWLNNYVPKLSGVLNTAVLEKTRDTIQKSLLEGSTLPERMKSLQDISTELSAMTKSRIEAIARTEITRADTMGRLISMKANSDVIGVEFSAIMDDRTTDICSSRHGLVMRIDDPILPYNSPPLHVNCRSMLLPLTVYEYPDGLLTSAEFEEVPAGIQRVEDVEEVQKILAVEVSIPQVDEAATITARLKELQNKDAEYKGKYDELQLKMELAAQAKDIDTYNVLSREQSALVQEWKGLDLDNQIRAIKIEAAEKKIIFASGLSKTLDSIDIEKIIEAVKNAPEEVRKVWNIYEDKMKIADKNSKGSYYAPSEGSIYINIWKDKALMSRPDYSTTFHELGHLIDYKATGSQLNYSRSPEYAFMETLKSEVDEYVNARLVQLKAEAVSKGRNPKEIKKSDAHASVESEIHSLQKNTSILVSDIFSGATLNKCSDGWIHSTSYWKSEPRLICGEFFAQAYSDSIVNPQGVEITKKYFPKSYKIFSKMLKDITQ